MLGIALFLSLSVLFVGTYLIWPSRFNVPAHINVGFILPAYFSPLVILETQDIWPESLVNIYSYIIIIGAATYVAGMLIGVRLKVYKWSVSFTKLPPFQYDNRAMRLTKTFMIIGVIGLLLSYLIMGFVPILASDPIAAKFFRGVYAASYARAAILYRSSFYILTNLIPLSLIIWYVTKKKIFLIVVIAAFVLMLAALSRGPAFTGVLIALIIISIRFGKIYFKIFFISLFIIFAFGASFYYIFNIVDYSSGAFNVETKKAGLTFWKIISSGTPDVSDQLYFLSKYLEKPELTYGKTFFGGLVPGHYKWNPNVYSLNVVSSDSDIDEVISGGLRLPVPIWGYISFGWLGVITIPLLSGIITGYITKLTKLWIKKTSSLITFTVIVLINMLVLHQFETFYLLNIYNIPPTIIMLFYLYKVKLK